MAFEMEIYDDWDQPEDMVGSGGMPKPGKYHCQITDAIEGDKSIELQFEISSPGSECGKHFREWLNFNSNSEETTKKLRGRIGLFALRFGVVTPDDWRACKEQGKPLRFDPVDFMGKQAIVELVNQKDQQGRERVRVAWAGVYHLDDEAAEGVPVDPELAAMVGYSNANNVAGAADPFGGSGPNGSGQQQHPQPVAATAETDEFDV